MRNFLVFLAKKRSNYYPFGMLLPGRHANTSDYRYGFQGQELDNEIKGEGNSLNYTFRMHDPRVGRFFAEDPLSPEYPWYSPYQFGGNKAIAFGELEGLEEYHAVNNKDWRWRLYAIQKGDNFQVISQNTGVAVEDIIGLNPQIANPDKIYPGQWIQLNDGSALTPDDFVFEDRKSGFEIAFMELISGENSIQQQAEDVLNVATVAGGIQILRNLPKGIRAVKQYFKGKKGNRQPKIPVEENAAEVSTLDNVGSTNKAVNVKAKDLDFTVAEKGALKNVTGYSRTRIVDGVGVIDKFGFYNESSHTQIKLIKAAFKRNGATSIKIKTNAVNDKMRNILNSRMKSGKGIFGLSIKKRIGPGYILEGKL